MNRSYKNGSATIIRKLPIILSAAAFTSVAYGQSVVEPATEPFMTLAPYALQSTNLEVTAGNEDGGTRAYRPWFESGSWTGDLIEYEITKDGSRLIRGDIGRYPRDGADWRGTQQLWSARYAFPDYQHYDQSLELDPAWECTEEDVLYWRNRNLFTMSEGLKVGFFWDQLSDQQRLTLDSATAADPALDEENDASPILNFVRGDRSNERCKEGGTYRWRFSVLGAIVNSLPAYVPAGNDGLVVVGANDGMLHGFSAADGSELFGYVPSMLLGTVGALRISPYQPSHFVDGELRHRDIGSSTVPQHIVSGGLGAGGKGIFVLDVTTPANPAVLRELSGTDAPFVGGSYDERIGHIYGRPTIARLPNGTPGGGWYVVSGNGYLSNDGRAYLVLIPLDGSAPEYIATDATGDNGLSAPSLVDTTGNGIVDYAYAGDLHGNLWRFGFQGGNRTVSKLFAAGPSKPITVEPDIGMHEDTQQGHMIYFGTGSLLSGADVQNTGQQTVYGIWDRGDGQTVLENRLVTQTLVSDTVTWPIPQDPLNYCAEVSGTTSETTVRFIANPQNPTWSGSTPDLGWQVNLPGLGERLIGHPQIRAGRVQFVTTNPYDMSDPDRSAAEGAGSWIVQLDLLSGGNAKNPVALFDLNKNCILDGGDGAPEALTIGGQTVAEGTFPVGVNLGAYHIAQPSFARVRFDPMIGSVVDGVFINALQLPPPEDPGAPPSHGPLDVMTDSPHGPAHPGLASEPWLEPWKEPFANRQFPEASGPTKPFIRGDGLGHRVDGHSFAYNHHHGVDYVDLFDLEPQRDTWRLDVGAVYRASPPPDPQYLPLAPRISERELNRVTEVSIPPDQKFIVVLSNADLSRANEIQIGCRTWSVYDYQTIMMEGLRMDPGAMMDYFINDWDLVLTLDDIRPGGVPTPCDGGGFSTLRITPTDRIGALDATVATLPGCVNNTDRYRGGSGQNVHLTRKDGLNADGSFSTGTPQSLYSTDSHVTRNREGNGYRWRNGALTVQLLAVNEFDTPAFVLQPDAELPRGNGIEGQDQGWGGAYALGFTRSGNNIVPINNGSAPPAETAVSNGMLFELSMFWHWGDMTRFQQQGVGSPVTAFCYGTTGNVGPSLMYETDWFTPGAYQQLTEGFTEALQQQYVRLMQDLQSDNPEIVEAAIIALADMFEQHPNIATYHRLRHYVPNSKQLQEHHLIAIDSGGIGSELLDGTPLQVIDIERDLLPSLGPNYQPGRRSWIDLVPQ